MLYDNPYPKALNLLYKFTMLLSYLIVPSKKTIYPVLNFFLDRMENEKDE